MEKSYHAKAPPRRLTLGVVPRPVYLGAVWDAEHEDLLRGVRAGRRLVMPATIIRIAAGRTIDAVTMNIDLGITLHELFQNLLKGPDSASEDGSAGSDSDRVRVVLLGLPLFRHPQWCHITQGPEMSPDRRELDGGAASSSASESRSATTRREYHDNIRGAFSGWIC